MRVVTACSRAWRATNPRDARIHTVSIMVSIFSRFTDRIGRRFDQVLLSQGHTFAITRDLLDRSLFLNGQVAAGQVRQRDRLGTLADAEFRVTSQWGEDGIIEWLCHK